LNICQGRGVIFQAVDKRVDAGCITFQVHEDPLGVIMHGAGKAVGMGQVEDVGPEAHTLNDPPDSYNSMLYHGMLIVAQDCILA